MKNVSLMLVCGLLFACTDPVSPNVEARTNPVGRVVTEQETCQDNGGEWVEHFTFTLKYVDGVLVCVSEPGCSNE